MQSPAWFWTAFAAYALAMLVAGWYTRARVTDGAEGNAEYWIARRSLPGWRLGISLTAGWLMLGWVGFGMSQIYMYGATGLWILPIPWLILCAIIVWMVPYVRRLGAVSLLQALEQRFGKGVRPLLALVSWAVFLAWIQAELFMAGTLMSPFLGVPPWVCMAILVVVPLIYTWMGGFRAVVLTDVIQFGLMAVFMLVLAGQAWHAASTASGGHVLDGIAAAAPPWSGAGKALDLGFLGWAFPVVLLIGYLPGWLIEQDLLVRIQAAKSTTEARRGAWWGFLLIGIFVIGLPALIGFASLVAFPPAGAEVNAAVGANALNIVSALVQQLPAMAAVGMFLGIVACQMSTVDTFANVGAMALSYDLIEPRLGATAWKGRLFSAKLVTAGTMLAGFIAALFSESLNDVYYISSGVLSACIAVPAIAIFWQRATGPAVFAAAAVGLVVTVGGFWLETKHLTVDAFPEWLKGCYGYTYLAAGVLTSAIALISTSLATRVVESGAVQAAPVDDTGDFMRRAYAESV